MILKFLTAISVFFLAVIQPIQNTLIALLCFIVADVITGVWKSLKAGNFQSRKFSESIGKIFLYFIAILVTRISDLYFDLPKVNTVVTSLIVVSEVISVLENISVITGIPIIEKVQTLFKRPKNED